jgi:hypothetical protein
MKRFVLNANNADKYIKYKIRIQQTIERKLTIYNWQLNWQSACFKCPDPPRQSILFNVFNFVLLGQLTFNYFEMHLLNNQLCLYSILCLCKQLYAIYMYAKNWACTPDLPAMIIVQHCSYSKQISWSRNICNIFLVYRQPRSQGLS